MKIPSGAAGAVQALLATKKFIYADCFTFVLVNAGGYFRFTNAGAPVGPVTPYADAGDGLGPVTYSASGLIVEGLRYTASTDLSVDEQDVNLSYRPTDTILGIPWQAALRFGVLDGARIMRDRWFAPAWGQAWVGACSMFYGRVSTIDSAGRVDAQIKVKADTVLLNTQMPRSLYQPNCLNTLYDSMCTLTRSSYGTNGIVGAGGSATVIPWAGAAANLSLGVVMFTSGPNNAVRRTIRTATGSALVLAYPLNFAPAAGDTFRAYRGCTKVYTDGVGGCLSFANQVNFRAFPFLPTPDTAV